MTKSLNYCIYKITSPSNKSYIGLTCDFKRRMSQHSRHLTSNNTALSNAIAKYGFSNMTIDILFEGLTLDDANNFEIKLIRELNTLSPHGYNLHTGGDSHQVSNVTAFRISNGLKGKKHSVERIEQRMSKIRGRKYSQEHKQKIANSKIGKKLSESTIKKLSEIRKGRKLPLSQIAIAVFNRNKKEFLKEYAQYVKNIKNVHNDTYYNVSELAVKLGITTSPLYKRIRKNKFGNTLIINGVKNIARENIIQYYELNKEVFYAK